jgi:hypothetical protein
MRRYHQAAYVAAAFGIQSVFCGFIDQWGHHSTQESIYFNNHHQKQFRMKKVKWTIMSLTVILSVCGAFATKPHFDCSNMQQYYFAGGRYTLAGTYGVDYICVTGAGPCTYYTTDGINFFPCQAGTRCTANCFVRENPKPAKPNQTPNSAAATAAQ